MLYFDEAEFTATERANKTALLLIRERYDAQLGKFVGKSPHRLTYVGKQIDRMIDEICKETQAELDYVASRFNIYLKDRLAAEGYDIRFTDEAPGLENVEKDDVTRPSGEVEGAGTEEALNPPGLKKVDLKQGAYTAADAGNPSDESTWKTCFRCEDKLNPVYAQSSPVCVACTDELMKLAWGDEVGVQGPGMGMGTGVSDPSAEADVVPASPGQQFRCSICNAMQGTHDEVITHVQNDHADVLQRQQQEYQRQPDTGMGQTAPLASTRTGDTEEPQPAKVEPLPETPVGEFDSMVQDLAEKAAAIQFSRPDANMIHTLASQLGVDENQLQQNLVSIAIFGNYVGRNGELSEDATPPEGWEEVSNEASGGPVSAHEALIPTDTVVSKVAEQQNMDSELAYNMIRDHYGGTDLPEQFHASVNGEAHLYLPTELAGNQQQAPQEPPVQNYDPNTGPAMPPAPQPQPAM